MKDYNEIENLFNAVLEEKDKFKISKSASQITERLNQLHRENEMPGLKKEDIDSLENMLNIYSMIYTDYMKSEVKKHMDVLLNGIAGKENN